MEVTLITKKLGIRFWEVYQNNLIPTIITQTTIAIITIIEIITTIIIATIIIIATTTVITVIITIILQVIATTHLQIDYNVNLSI